MKNYISLYAIILILAVVFWLSNREIASVRTELLDPTNVMIQKISNDEPVAEDYEKLCSIFEHHETVINVFINHSVYNSIVQCLEEIGNDIEHNLTAELEADAKRLAYYLQDIVDGEKIKINNIF